MTLTDDPQPNKMAQVATESERRPRPPPPAPRQPRGPMIRRDSENRDKTQPLINISSWDSNEKSSGRRPGPSGYRPSNGERPRDRDRDYDRERRPRPRRNSDSSVVEAHEAENRDRSRRDRYGRDPRSKDSKSRRENASDKKKKHPALDVIDKLDVTGIYGSGRKFGARLIGNVWY